MVLTNKNNIRLLINSKNQNSLFSVEPENEKVNCIFMQHHFRESPDAFIDVKRNKFFFINKEFVNVFNLDTGVREVWIKHHFKNFGFFRKPKNKDLVYCFQKNSEEKITEMLVLNTDNFSLKMKITPVNNKFSKSLKYNNADIQQNGDMLSHFVTDKSSQILLSKEPSLSPLDFPINQLKKVFNRNSYSKAIRVYASYYFNFISSYFDVDYFFGPINPLHLCVYHNDYTLLSELLNQYTYPITPDHLYISPLEYAFQMQKLSCVNSFCDYFIEEHISFQKINYREFMWLLKSKSIICEKVLAGQFIKLKNLQMPQFIWESDFRIVQETDNLLNYQIEKIHEKKSQNPSKNISELYNSTKQQKKNDLVEIKTYYLPFEFDFSLGSSDMIILSYYYMSSKVEDFITSEWKMLHNDRWNKFWPYHLFLSIIYWAYSIFFIVDALLPDLDKYLKWITLGLGIISIIYELLQMRVYFLFRPSV